MLYYYSHVKKNMKKIREAASELGKFHDVTRFVTLTCQKSVLWVRGTASKQLLCSLLHKNSDVFMESFNTDQKGKLLTFLIMHHTCQNSKHKYLFPNIQKFLTSIFFISIHLTREIGHRFQTIWIHV